MIYYGEVTYQITKPIIFTDEDLENAGYDTEFVDDAAAIEFTENLCEESRVHRVLADMANDWNIDIVSTYTENQFEYEFGQTVDRLKAIYQWEEESREKVMLNIKR